MGYKLSWTLVSSATAYKLQYSIDGGDYIDLTTTTNNYYDLSGMSAGGDYVLSVISQATGYTDSDRATIEYKPRAVSYSLTNCSASLQKTVTQYGATFLSFSISPTSGYNFGTGATYSVYNGTTPVALTVSDGIIAVPSFIVGGAVTVNVSAAATNYSVTNTLTNCTSNNSATSVSHGASYSATLTAASGYTLTGATASVKMGGVDITSTAYSAGVITISSVTGAIVITVSAVATNYSVTNTLTNCTSNNSATSVSHGASYSATLTAASGYTLTGATASVKMGGVDITSTAYSAGVITISSVTGAIAITVSAIQLANQLSGVWVCKAGGYGEMDLAYSMWQTQSINYASNGVSYTYMKQSVSGDYTYLYYDNTSVCTLDADINESSWTNEAYRTIDFGTTSQTVSEAFYTWFTANATKQ